MSVPPNPQHQIEALSLYAGLDPASLAAFGEIAELAGQICGTSAGTVLLADDRRLGLESARPVDSIHRSIEISLCAETLRQSGEVTVVTDLHQDARFSSLSSATTDSAVRFFAGAPLITPEGVAIGTVFVTSPEPRELSTTQRSSLRSLARQAVALLEAARWRSAFHAEQEKRQAIETSEAYFRHLTEYSLDLISILEADGTIRFESRSIERELGYDPEHYRGRNAFEFVHPDDLAGVAESFTDALLHHGHTPVIRFRFRHADGSYRLLEGMGNNLLDDPAVRGVVFNSRDVTERYRLQEEIEQTRAEKEETLARLTGGVAHDFNNVLAAIRGMSELTVQEVPPGSAAARHLACIQSATARAANLTQQLLAFSRRLVLQPRALQLAHWLHDLRPRLSALVGPKVIVDVGCEAGLYAWKDPAMLEQVFLHLASNARDAMPSGGRFSITATSALLQPGEFPGSERNEAECYARITVSDSGGGIAECTLARIFEPFFTTKSGGHHPGLGLSMCRGIIEQSGGHLLVQSQLDQGTVFHIFLPTQEEPVVPLLPVALKNPADQNFPSTTGRTTILLVDDEPMLRDIGETVLTEAGYSVLVAEDGPSALERLKELGPDTLSLLLTDVVMPGMTGVQLAEEVSRLRPGTPVLLCSGYTRDALSRCGGLPSGVAFLDKPYSLSCLLEKVENVLNCAA